jgi:hypothetical protein
MIRVRPLVTMAPNCLTVSILSSWIPLLKISHETK